MQLGGSPKLPPTKSYHHRPNSSPDILVTSFMKLYTNVYIPTHGKVSTYSRF